MTQIDHIWVHILHMTQLVYSIYSICTDIDSYIEVGRYVSIDAESWYTYKSIMSRLHFYTCVCERECMCVCESMCVCVCMHQWTWRIADFEKFEKVRIGSVPSVWYSAIVPVLVCVNVLLQHTAKHTATQSAAHCNTLQHNCNADDTALLYLSSCAGMYCCNTHCNTRCDTHWHTLQHTEAHCNTLKHTVIHAIQRCFTCTHVWM